MVVVVLVIVGLMAIILEVVGSVGLASVTPKRIVPAFMSLNSSRQRFESWNKRGGYSFEITVQLPVGVCSVACTVRMIGELLSSFHHVATEEFSRK